MIKEIKTKSKETFQEFLERLINKELEPYNITIREIREQNKNLWYQEYTFKTKEEFESWKEYCLREIKKRYKLNKELIETEFNWLNLNYGLKEEYNTNS